MKKLVKIAGLGLLLLSIGVFVIGCTMDLNSNETLFSGSRTIDKNDKIKEDFAVFGGDLTLAEHAEIDGHLAIFGGTVNIQKDAKVDGDLTMFGGKTNIQQDAKVDGDLTMFGGDISLQDHSEIDGDVTHFGGNINRSEKAVIDGEWQTFGEGQMDASLSDVADSFDLELDHENINQEELEAGIKANALPNTSTRSTTGVIVGFFSGILAILLKTVIFGVLGLVLTLFLPQHVKRIGQTAEKSPVASAAVGCLSIPALLVLTVIAMVTIIGIPIGILIPFFAAAAAILGWIGLGSFFGNRLLKMANIRAPRPAAAAAIGASSLALVGYGVQVIPIFGDLFMPFLSMWGLGATILTRGGRQSYPTFTKTNFRRPASVPPTFDPLDELDELDELDKLDFERSSSKEGSGGGIDSLFADLAADLGIDDMFDDDEDEDDKPNRPETPVKPSK